MTTSGLPVEVSLAPGSEADIKVFRRLLLALPLEAHIFADAGYLDQYEEALLKDTDLHLVAQRRSNSKEPLVPLHGRIDEHPISGVRYACQKISRRFDRT